MWIQCIVLEHHRDSSIRRCNLIHTFSINKKVSTCNLFKSCDHSECCGFTTSGWSDKCDKFFFFYI